MLLIRTKRAESVKKRKLVKISSHTIVAIIQTPAVFIAVPALVIWSGMGWEESFLYVMEHLHVILPAIIVVVWLAKTLFNVGQRVEHV